MLVEQAEQLYYARRGTFFSSFQSSKTPFFPKFWYAPKKIVWYWTQILKLRLWNRWFNQICHLMQSCILDRTNMLRLKRPFRPVKLCSRVIQTFLYFGYQLQVHYIPLEFFFENYTAGELVSNKEVFCHKIFAGIFSFNWNFERIQLWESTKLFFFRNDQYTDWLNWMLLQIPMD